MHLSLVSALAVLLVSLAVVALAAQQQEKSQPKTAAGKADAGLISLGAVVAQSGGKDITADVPLMYQPADNTGIRKVQADVTFVSERIQFVAVKPPENQTPKLEVTATSRELPPDPAGESREKRTQVSVTVSVADPDPKAVLPQGTIAVVTLKVPAKTPAESVWLDVTAVASGARPGTMALNAEPGRLIVTKYEETINFVGSCFFYMH